MPSTEPCSVSAVASCERAMPKSPSFTVPSLRAQHVRRLDVAVDEPGRVRGVERGGRAASPSATTSSAGKRAATPKLVRERLAVDVLHRDVEARARRRPAS